MKKLILQHAKLVYVTIFSFVNFAVDRRLNLFVSQLILTVIFYEEVNIHVLDCIGISKVNKIFLAKI